jgi:hypothetical protein
VFPRFLVVSATALALSVSSLSPHVSAQASDQPQATGSSDLDVFMEKVLARREVNRKVLNDYVLDEKEVFEILGPGRARLHRTSRDYTWFVKEGIHVRSPLRFEGVTVGDDERIKFEERWLQREKERIARKQKQEQEKAAGKEPDPESKQVTISSSGISTNALPTEPRFVSEAYFMDFKFERGNYFLAGRETLSGQEVLKIEYYPTKMFGGKDDEKTPRTLRKDRDEGERQLEQDIERKMNRTSLVTLWVDPKEHQIVKYTFDNVWLDFLPGAWLVRVDEMRASMTMFQPFEGVWLPRGIEIAAGITLANGSFDAAYERAFSDYRQADVKSKIRIPKVPAPKTVAQKTGTVTVSPQSGTVTVSETVTVPVFSGGDPETVTVPVLALTDGGSEPPVLARQQPEIVREIRVHGNAAVGEPEVLKIAGLAVGATVDGTVLADVERRLRASGHFETIEVRKRYRSLTDPTDVAIVLLVHEKVGVRTSASGEIERPVIDRINNRIMFLPILNFVDGYGFTYGARFSTVDLLGAGERLSVPLTWGGTRRVALEADRTFKRGPVTRLFGSVGLWQRENPGFTLEADDDDSTTERRVEFKARAERNVAQLVTVGVESSHASVDFGPLATTDQWTIGADAAIDTRTNPTFPANAIYVGAGWNALRVDGIDEPINRLTLDGRGYLRLIGQPVLAGRIQYFAADAELPLHERWLIGGSASLRGYRAGSFNGNKALIASAELRIPLTSVVSGGKLGMTVFADAAKVGDSIVRLEDARWNKSAGAGLFLIASIFRLNLDVGRQLRDGGGTRVHLSSGFAF